MTSTHIACTVILPVRRDSPRAAVTLESIVSQSAGFDANLEVLVVAFGGGIFDGEFSSDVLSSHPDRIRVLSVSESGRAAAMRLGLNEARGHSVTFLSAGNRLAPDAIRAVLDFSASCSPDDRRLLSVPVVTKLEQGKLRRGFARLPSRTGMVDLAAYPESLPLNFTGLFFDTEWLQSHQHLLAEDPTTGLFDELLTCIELIRAVEYTVGYIGGGGASIVGSDRADEKIDAALVGAQLERTLGYFEEALASDPSPALNSCLVFVLRSRVNRLDLTRFDEESRARAIPQRIRALMDTLSVAERYDSIWLSDRPMQFLLASAAFLDRPWSFDAGGQVRDHGVPVFSVGTLPVQVMRLNAKPSVLELEVVFHDFFTGDLELQLRSDSGTLLHAVERLDGTDGPGERVAGRYSSDVHYRRFEVPIGTTSSWRFVYTSDQLDLPIEAVSVKHHAKTAFAKDPERRRIFADTYTVSYSPDRGIIVDGRPSGRFAYKIRRALDYAREFRKLPWSVLASSARKNVILINDRAKYGNDNGEALFRYIQNERPDLRARTWFVLDEQAPSYRELEKTGRVVRPLTFRHRVLYMNSRLHFSSHVPATYNSPWRGEETSCLSDLVDPTFIWIRHGVTMNSVNKVYNRLNANLDGMVASAGYEVDYLKRPGSFFSDESLIASGLPRFDRLHDTSRDRPTRTLLYMPTWRTWLAGRARPDGAREPIEGFEESDYFAQQRRLLTDPDVLAALESADARIEFLIHPVMAVYQGIYESLASERVSILDPATTSYADLFARGAGMITDYSSVFVDFSYMRKPVVFDQTDVAVFRGEHYRDGLFDYGTQAPGPVTQGYEELKRATLEMIRGDFAVAPEYAHRLDDFFLHTDSNNSARVLEAGLSIDERRRGRPWGEG